LSEGIGLTLELVGRPGEVQVPLRQRPQLTTHLAQQLAVISALDQRQRFGVLGDQLGEPAHQAGALGTGHPSPGSGFDGLARRANRVINVVAPSFRRRRPYLTCVRVHAVEAPAEVTLAPLAAQEHLQMTDFIGRRRLYLHQRRCPPVPGLSVNGQRTLG
jgi:hypothetical protein